MMSEGTADKQARAVKEAHQTTSWRRVEETGQLVMSARMALRRGQRDEGKKLLNEALKVDPTDIGALELLGDLFLEDAEQEKAIRVFEHGLKYHPKHAAFEEKRALAQLDLTEMERDRMLREQVVETGDIDKWMDKKPALALGLSITLPGAGQFYNDQPERAAVFFALAFGTLCGWFYPLSNAVATAQKQAGRRSLPGLDEALGFMSGGTQFFFWLMLVSWVAIHAVSAYDAQLGALRFNEMRRRNLGIDF